MIKKDIVKMFCIISALSLSLSQSGWSLSFILKNKYEYLCQFLIFIKSWNITLKSFNSKAQIFSFSLKLVFSFKDLFKDPLRFSANEF